MDSDLYKAITCDDIDALREMEKRLKVGDQLTPTNSTVLHIACQYGSISCAREILSVHESLLLKINSRGETALHLAASQGHFDVAVALIDAAKSSKLQPNTSLSVAQILIRTANVELETALHAAVSFKRQDVVELLLKQDPRYLYPRNKYHETPLYLASFKCEYHMIDTILKICPLSTFEGPDGRTALHAAAMNRSGYECMKLLLNKRKDLIKIADNHGWTAYHYVAYNGIYEIVKDLVRVDKSVGYLVEKEHKRTALHIAAYSNKIDTLWELVKCFPDCWEVVDGNGQNILHIALEQYISNPRAAHTVRFIIRQGFKASNNLLNQRNNDGITPLHMIANSECYVEQLTDPTRADWVVDWDVVDKNNDTPLDVLHDRYMTDVYDRGLPNQALVRRTRNGVFLEDNSSLLEIFLRKQCGRRREQDLKKLEFFKGKNDIEKVEEYRRAINTHMIVAALITTVAITAGFAMPGGFDGNEGPTQGSPILIKKTAFKIFIATDTIALLFSLSSLFLYFIATWFEDVSSMEITILVSAVLNIFSITSIMVAFITGTYAVLAPSPGIAVSACVISSFFFLLILYTCARIVRRVYYVILS
ncbi:protein ACCELERATED CELL DEATH 6-like [Apium graveolens]|uniref:protein ACCELERATED CELL DEATH 6-like n=1 Tax=Apium graveolens TaxID=4045 RepID=UPI003D798824